MTTPTLLILGGANGAGKSTTAAVIIPDGVPFLNADEIAKQLPEEAGKHVQAGRQLLNVWETLIAERTSFAVEATLSNRTMARRIQDAQAAGYSVHLIYLWLPTADLAVQRVAERVRNGGHDIPEDVIRRRHRKGWLNFLRLYRPIADTWHVSNNEVRGNLSLVAFGKKAEVTAVLQPELWQKILEVDNE
jgi:predicted ABC-type ATPase